MLLIFSQRVFLFFVVIVFASCAGRQEKASDLVNNPASAEGNEDPSKFPQIVFQEEKHDFGKITQGEKVSYTFHFKNTGGANLVITSAQGSCGCTVPKFPKEPVAPGQDAAIEVEFDSDGKEGIVKKTITVITNANPSTRTLTIISEIIVPQPSKK